LTHSLAQFLTQYITILLLFQLKHCFINTIFLTQDGNLGPSSKFWLSFLVTLGLHYKCKHPKDQQCLFDIKTFISAIYRVLEYFFNAVLYVMPYLYLNDHLLSGCLLRVIKKFPLIHPESIGLLAPLRSIRFSWWTFSIHCDLCMELQVAFFLSIQSYIARIMCSFENKLKLPGPSHSYLLLTSLIQISVHSQFFEMQPTPVYFLHHIKSDWDILTLDVQIFELLAHFLGLAQFNCLSRLVQLRGLLWVMFDSSQI
jgi:hypothetical protein